MFRVFESFLGVYGVRKVFIFFFFSYTLVFGLDRRVFGGVLEIFVGSYVVG